MWTNIGRKLQSLAQTFCWIGIILSVITALSIWLQNNTYQPVLFTGLLVLILGSLGSWIGSWVLFGFGVIVDKFENGAVVMTSPSHAITPQSMKFNSNKDVNNSSSINKDNNNAEKKYNAKEIKTPAAVKQSISISETSQSVKAHDDNPDVNTEKINSSEYIHSEVLAMGGVKNFRISSIGKCDCCGTNNIPIMNIKGSKDDMENQYHICRKCVVDISNS